VTVIYGSCPTCGRRWTEADISRANGERTARPADGAPTVLTVQEFEGDVTKVMIDAAMNSLPTRATNEGVTRRDMAVAILTALRARGDR
jgi:hypothetical protein